MEQDIASIWLSIPRRGNKKLIIGAIYREHQLKRRHQLIDSSTPQQQKMRWRKFISQWEHAAAGNTEVVIIGDTNLDKLKWENPEQILVPLVEDTKNRIESIGFIHLVKGFTTSWPHTEDLLVDQLWTNVPFRIDQCNNVVRIVADHNVLAVVIRIKGERKIPQEILKRKKNLTRGVPKIHF